MGDKVHYVNISVPDKLGEAIDRYIKEHPELDLRSRTQVVNFALRFLFIETNRKWIKVKKK